MSDRLTRRQFLAAGAGAALLAGCARGPLTGKSSTQRSISKPSSYQGPPVALQYWTGFTGGDGPVMQGMVGAFNDAHPNISVTMNVVRWEEDNGTVVLEMEVPKVHGETTAPVDVTRAGETKPQDAPAGV